MQHTKENLLSQIQHYEKMEIQDAYKYLYQSTFGCGHLVGDETAAADFIRREAEHCVACQPAIEPLDGHYSRVHLCLLKQTGLTAETLAAVFALSAAETGEREELEERLAQLEEMAERGELPFSPNETTQAVENWRRRGYPACRHSQTYRQWYQPSYRVIANRFVPLLPLLAEIDRLRAAGEPVRVALEGGSASGKSTMGKLLGEIYRCPVLHMDDFFLRPHQRTAERMEQIGGNVDWERFRQEVLIPLSCGKTAQYRRYDCQSGTLLPPVEVSPQSLVIVEGAYSMHPELAEFYHWSAFLSVTPEEQRQSILRRNGAEMGERFFQCWIPLEQRYFAATHAQKRCRQVLYTEE